MPEIVTKYPKVLLQELKDIGAKCGVGARQQILKKCPRDHFCALPTGEICVYDLKEVSTMTQIHPSEWTETVAGIPSILSSSNLILLIFVFGVGVVIGAMLNKKNQ